MRKLITLSEPQLEMAERIKTETLQTGLGGLLVYLMLYYEQTKRKAHGRPKNAASDDDDDDGALYYTPDYPSNPNKYTYAELESWYAYDERRGKMPPREELKRADQ